MKLKYSILAASLMGMAAANGALVTWGSASGLSATTDISNAGTAVAAVDYGDATAPTVNTVVFSTASDSFSSTFWTDTEGSSGDTDLDNLINGHTSGPGGSTAFTLALTGLTSGHTYQIQLIGTHDARGCCGSRTYTVGNGDGTYSSNTLTRNAGETIIGTFVADGTTQNILVGGNTGDGDDAGLSGYVLRQTAVPEPSSAALLGLGGLALILRRRK